MKAEETRRDEVKRANLPLALLTIGLLVLGSAVLYQQSQLSTLSERISSQASELAHPSTVLTITYAAVIKANATAIPTLFVGLQNDGQAPMSSGDIQANVFGSNNSIQTCTLDLSRNLPLFTNESTLAYVPLPCRGELGDRVYLNVGVIFLTPQGSVSISHVVNTTIALPEIIKPNKTTAQGISVQSWVEPGWVNQVPSYAWQVHVGNVSPNPIIALNVTLRAAGKTVGSTTSCYPGLSFGSSRLDGGSSCDSTEFAIQGTGPFQTGQHLDVLFTVKFLNGTTSVVQASAVVEPVYAFYFLSSS